MYNRIISTKIDVEYKRIISFVALYFISLYLHCLKNKTIF